MCHYKAPNTPMKYTKNNARGKSIWLFQKEKLYRVRDSKCGPITRFFFFFLLMAFITKNILNILDLV